MRVSHNNSKAHEIPAFAGIYTFISTSTPLGSSNFIKASIVFEEEL
jgi:hypothetical protein